MPHSRILERQIAVRARTRPIRVAYFLADGPHAASTLDAIFAEAYGRWGGIQTLIVPVELGEIDDRYWSWLQWFDPDIIYSYTDLTHRRVNGLRDDLNPLLAIDHREWGIGGIELPPRPNVETPGLTPLSNLPALAAYRRAWRSPKPLLLDEYHWGDSGFVGDSFGFANRSTGRFPMSVPAREYADPIVLTLGGTSNMELHRTGIRDVAAVHSETELLTQLAATHPIITMAELSGFNTPGPSRTAYEHPWTHGLSIVAGDSFTDRLCFWNGRLLFEASKHGTLTGLRIPEAKLEDEAFLEALAAFARNKSHHVSGSSQGHVLLQSASVPKDRLEAIAVKLRKFSQTPTIATEISSTATVVPSPKMLSQMDWYQPDDFEILASQSPFLANPPGPTHLRIPEQVPVSLKSGHWISELAIERPDERYELGERHSWLEIPARPEFAHLFFKDAKGRITKSNRLALVRNDDTPGVRIRIPTDQEIFDNITQAMPQASLRSSDIRYSTSPTQIYEDARVSDKGRYVTGAIGLFGSLSNAKRMIESPFWRGRLLGLSMPSSASEGSETSRIMETLKKRIDALQPDASRASEGSWQEIAAEVYSTSLRLRTLPRTDSISWLRQHWHAQLSASLETDHQFRERSGDRLLARAGEELDSAIEEACNSGLFIQGYGWACRKCGNKNWRAIDQVGLRMPCVVCEEVQQAPANLDWQFALSPFLAESIRAHGVLPVIWSLGFLEAKSESSFLFAPPTSLFKERTKDTPDAEVDILCIRDGRLTIGEVKTNFRMTPKEIERLAGVAQLLKAEEVVLACFEDPHGRLEACVKELQAKVDSQRCQVKSMMPGGRFTRPDFYL